MSEIKKIIKQQRIYFGTGITRDYEFRLGKLKRLYSLINKYETEILMALKKDLNKPAFEAYETEIGPVLSELRSMIRCLKEYMKPRSVKTPVTNFPAVSKIYAEPYGVVLIVSPWNYPFQLSIAPLIGAIAAGNCVVVKPSDDAPQTSAILAKIIENCFHEAHVTVVQGGIDVNTALLEQKLDYIFFTGSVAVGKIMMQAAAKHLTPVSLELGGKSPCIVDETANIEITARRIVWGKFLNAGQTCVAPDYVLVHSKVKEELVEAMKKYILRFYGDKASNNEEFPKIVTKKHYYRLLGLLENGRILFGGDTNEMTNQIGPTLIDEVSWNSAIMKEEIFGPLLPILTYDSLKEAVGNINNRPKPLALYLFTTKKEHERYILRNVSYGGGCVNDTVMHLANSGLPFGGVGESGMGNYHGKSSFDTFSHHKSVLKKSFLVDVMLRYPPYDGKLKLIKKFMK